MGHIKFTQAAASVSPTEDRLLQITVDAMMDSLTIEQRKKLAAYIIRNARAHTFTYSHGNAKPTPHSLGS